MRLSPMSAVGFGNSACTQSATDSWVVALRYSWSVKTKGAGFAYTTSMSWLKNHKRTCHGNVNRQIYFACDGGHYTRRSKRIFAQASEGPNISLAAPVQSIASPDNGRRTCVPLPTGDRRTFAEDPGGGTRFPHISTGW